MKMIFDCSKKNNFKKNFFGSYFSNERKYSLAMKSCAKQNLLSGMKYNTHTLDCYS